MNDLESLKMLIAKIGSGEWLMTEIGFNVPMDRSALPPWAPDEVNWHIKISKVPEDYREPVVLIDKQEGK